MYARLKSDGGLLKVNVNKSMSVIKRKEKPVPDFLILFTVTHLEIFTDATLHCTTHTHKRQTPLRTVNTPVCLVETLLISSTSFSATLITCHIKATHLQINTHRVILLLLFQLQSTLAGLLCCDPMFVQPVNVPCLTLHPPLGELVHCWTGVNGPIIYLHAALHFEMFSLNHPQFLCSSLPKTLPLPE